MRGTEGKGGTGVEAARKTGGKESRRHLPHSSFLQQTPPKRLILVNHGRPLVSAYSIPGLVPSTSEASSHLSLRPSRRPLPFHTPIPPLSKLRPREMKSHFFIQTSLGLRPPGYIWQNWHFNPALSDPTLSIRNCVHLHVPASCQVTL